MTETGWRDRIRREILHFEPGDGGLVLYDPIFDRITRLDAGALAGLEAGDPAPLARLEAALLLEGPIVASIREATIQAKLATHPRPAPAREVPDFDWSLAAALPPQVVRPEWREPERLRRLAEERAAGRRILMLRGFVDDALVDTLREAIAALEFTRLETELVHAERHLVQPGELEPWTAFMQAPATRAVLGAVLGVETLPETTVLNAWRLQAGDSMGAHADGKRYRATISLGLARHWRAADGGAIAFGTPKVEGLEVHERWLPHAGDVLLFAPDVDTWHAVEPVTTGPRHTLTGWWMM